MKNWLTRVAAVVLTAATLTSCDKDENKVTVAPSGNLTLTASRTAVGVLIQDAAAQTALTYNWNPISFTLNGADGTKAPLAKYELQVARTKDGFGYPAPIDAGTGSTKEVTVEQLNAALIRLNFAPDVAATAYVRVAAVVGSDTKAFTSTPVAITATPYKFCQQPDAKKAWAIIGPAGKGWGDTDDVVMRYDCDTKNYVYTGPLKADSFKFRYGGAWAANLGGTAPTGGALTHDGPDMKIPAAGIYTIVLTPGPLTADGKASPSTFTISQ